MKNVHIAVDVDRYLSENDYLSGKFFLVGRGESDSERSDSRVTAAWDVFARTIVDGSYVAANQRRIRASGVSRRSAKNRRKTRNRSRSTRYCYYRNGVVRRRRIITGERPEEPRTTIKKKKNDNTTMQYDTRRKTRILKKINKKKTCVPTCVFSTKK